VPVPFSLSRGWAGDSRLRSRRILANQCPTAKRRRERTASQPLRNGCGNRRYARRPDNTWIPFRRARRSKRQCATKRNTDQLWDLGSRGHSPFVHLCSLAIVIYQNFACPLNKVGGHVRWIQSDGTPCDGNGNPMQFVGQFLGSRDVELGDGGAAYVFFSDETRETKAVLQYY
jgi:hypothetical protein